MRPGHHAAIGGQQGDPLGIEVVLSDDVIRLILGVQPVNEVRIGRELPEALLGTHI
jgi:hypothetical protein